MNKLDNNTLTKEQLKLIDLGYHIYINDDGKLVTETPQEIKINIIHHNFNNRINQFTAGYSQAEIDTWSTKVIEAEKVIAGKQSILLSSLLIEGEDIQSFANNILQKAKQYSDLYIQAEKNKRQELAKLKLL